MQGIDGLALFGRGEAREQSHGAGPEGLSEARPQEDQREQGRLGGGQGEHQQQSARTPEAGLEDAHMAQAIRQPAREGPGHQRARAIDHHADTRVLRRPAAALREIQHQKRQGHGAQAVDESTGAHQPHFAGKASEAAPGVHA